MQTLELFLLYSAKERHHTLLHVGGEDLKNVEGIGRVRGQHLFEMIDKTGRGALGCRVEAGESPAGAANAYIAGEGGKHMKNGNGMAKVIYSMKQSCALCEHYEKTYRTNT